MDTKKFKNLDILLFSSLGLSLSRQLSDKYFFEKSSNDLVHITEAYWEIL